MYVSSQFRKGQWIPVFTVSVTVEFKAENLSPQMQSKDSGEKAGHLKSGVLELDFDSNGLWLGRAEFVEARCAYWEEKPSPSTPTETTASLPPPTASPATPPPATETPIVSSPEPATPVVAAIPVPVKPPPTEEPPPAERIAPAELLNQPATQPAEVKPRSAWEVIERAIEVTGGKYAWSEMRALHTKSQGTLLWPGTNSFTYAADTSLQMPDRIRNQMKINRSATQPDEVLVVVDGSQGWEQTGSRVRKLPMTTLAEAREESYGANLLWLMSLRGRAGFILTLLGESVSNDQTLVGVLVTSQGHAEVKLYFDKDTGLLTKRVQSLPTAGRARILQEASYEEYRDFEGLKLATKFSVSRDGKRYAEVKMLDADFSTGFDDRLFVRP